MSKIVDPVIDYFFQIPLSEGNILQFLSKNGFKVSKVQNPDGSTKSLLFYCVNYPSKSVQFNDEEKGIENFLYPFQESLFFILDETELTFIIKTPRKASGIAIKKGDDEMNFPVRRVNHSGEKSNTKTFSLAGQEVDLTKKSNNYLLSHDKIQKIFMNFIENKKLLDLNIFLEKK